MSTAIGFCSTCEREVHPAEDDESACPVCLGRLTSGETVELEPSEIYLG